MTTRPMDLSKLTDPFAMENIEWRVSRAGMGRDGIFCLVLAYVTARAIQARFDAVCGPENWRLEEPRMLDVNGKSAFACGLSIRIGEEWVTKWDVAEPTNVEPAKGGWSSAVKRAGCAWGAGRYLYYLDETFAEVTEEPIQKRGWNYARLPEKHGGGVYYWKPPGLPAWALPKESEYEVSADQVNQLKQKWRKKFALDCRNPKELGGGFERFVHSIVGVFPVSDESCWTSDALSRVDDRIESTEDANGVSADVPFEDAKP